MKKTMKTQDLEDRLHAAVDVFKDNRMALNSYKTEHAGLMGRLAKLQEKVSKLQEKMSPNRPITPSSIYVAETMSSTYEKIAYVLEDIASLQWEIHQAERALASSVRKLAANQARYVAITGKILPKWAAVRK